MQREVFRARGVGAPLVTLRDPEPAAAGERAAPSFGCVARLESPAAICGTVPRMPSSQPESTPAPPGAAGRDTTRPAAKDQWTSGDAYEIWMGRWSRLLAADFLRWLDAPAGARWLDVCCGGGALTDAILARCRPALIRGVDRSPAQIAFARRHPAPPAAFCLADAAALPFRDQEFDLSVCGLGLNFLPDAPAALRAMRRVTRPGGAIAAYVWDYAGKMRFLREFWDAALAVDPEAADFDQGRRFPICSPKGLQDAFHAAGLHSPATCELDITTHFSSFDDYWHGFSLLQGSAPVYLASRSEAVREAIRTRLHAALPANADGSIILRARALAIRAGRH